ncbi:MAG: TCR/Tet family MFS transporter [Cyclobacteriaceae bacterium]|nr:TCR/Tet family MFS transporter [Cyclobacteriaceae bacterium]
MVKQRTPAVGFIFATLLIDVAGLGIIIPVTPKLIAELINGDMSQAAVYGGWLWFAYAFMQFICAPIIGNLSDQYGRRPILLASLFGFGIDYVFLAFAPTITWLFVGMVLAGVLGASFTTASAYIADVSTPEKRAQNFGLIGVAFGVGFIIGPVLGGLIGDAYGSRAPFIASSILVMINWIYGYFILPESLKPENRRKFEWKRANPIGALRHLRRYQVISGLVVSLVLIYLSSHAIQGTWSYYVMKKFDWSPAEVGWSLGFVGLVAAIVQGGLIRVIIPKLGNQRGVYVGLGLYAVGFLLFGLAPSGWMMYPIIALYGLGGIAGPSLQGIISNNVPANEQGELQGGLTSLISFTSIIGPPIMSNLFAYFTSPGVPYVPGAPMFAGAFLTLASTLLARRSLKRTGG